MQERAESIHARLEVKSEPGSGTQIYVVWTEDEEQVSSSRGGQDE
jgi:nitrate/nitrite-specific signal transduction histidine kinase